MANEILTQERLKQLVTYDPESGLFSRINQSSKKVGYINPKGYLLISINKKNYMAHRLAWLYVNGEFPPDQIDHINRIPNDNRLVNLRLADSSLNNRNKKIQQNNQSGVKGVWFNKDKTHWCAQISIKGKWKYIGQYKLLSDAIQARKIAEIILNYAP